MSTDKQPRLPNTDEVFHELAAAQRGIEHLAGTVLLDRYRLTKLLGSGGAAVVYRAEHVLMQKTVAVKILRPELAARPDFVQRFLAEARTVARLRHENIVDIVDVGRTETGTVFCVMEYLEGEELASTMDRDGPMPWTRARDIVMQVCHALAAAHAAGVVHRDVKPQNCFRIRHGKNADFIKLLDFGIAKQTDNDQGLTATGVIMGTAEYMSPEQARGSADVDGRADIYSVGAMLFEMLAGRPPFEGDTFIDVLVKHASEPAPKLSSLIRGVDPAVDALLARTLAKKPEDRFGSIEQLLAAFVTNDGHSFQATFDSAILTARPDSVLPRSTSSHEVAAAVRKLDSGGIAAIAVGIVLVTVVIVLASRDWSSNEASTMARAERQVESATPSASPQATPIVAVTTAAQDEDEPDVTIVTDDKPSAPPTTTLPSTAPLAPLLQPPISTSPEPPAAPVVKPKAKVPSPKPASDSALPSVATGRTRLQMRIMGRCGPHVKRDHSLTIKVDGDEYTTIYSAGFFAKLRACIDDFNIPVSDLRSHSYKVTLPAPKVPEAPNPFEP